MRISLLMISILMLAIVATAQVPIPGTFSSVPAQPVQYGTPILAPPTASLGNGLTPTVITNKQTVLVAAPQNIPLEASTLPPGTPATANASDAGAQGQQAQPAQAATPQGTMPRKHFDFVVGSAPAAEMGSGASDNLAEIARSMRKPGATPMSGKAFTNDDIGRINQKYGSRPTSPASQGPGMGNSAGVSGTAVQPDASQNPETNQSAPAAAQPVPR